MFSEPSIDPLFKALGHPARLAVVERLSRGPRTTGELAALSDMALPSFTAHLKVLEECGLVSSRKRGRVRTWQLRPERLAQGERWLAQQRALWEARLDQLDAYLTRQESP
ncbi:MAG: helix-turn-helix transcriptional regulator [Alphaproteobacteria bacterium]|nr:helix-turn-helix transcriptional regulator [Alphaproteobacteria bacterium]